MLPDASKNAVTSERKKAAHSDRGTRARGHAKPVLTTEGRPRAPTTSSGGGPFLCRSTWATACRGRGRNKERASGCGPDASTERRSRWTVAWDVHVGKTGEAGKTGNAGRSGPKIGRRGGENRGRSRRAKRRRSHPGRPHARSRGASRPGSRVLAFLGALIGASRLLRYTVAPHRTPNASKRRGSTSSGRAGKAACKRASLTSATTRPSSKQDRRGKPQREKQDDPPSRDNSREAERRVRTEGRARPHRKGTTAEAPPQGSHFRAEFPGFLAPKGKTAATAARTTGSRRPRCGALAKVFGEDLSCDRCVVWSSLRWPPW
jgi:hypothetical protein